MNTSEGSSEHAAAPAPCRPLRDGAPARGRAGGGSGTRGGYARTVTHVRSLDPAREHPAVVADLNDWPPETRTRLAEWYARGLTRPENVLLAFDGGAIVGCAHLFDAGLPFAIIEGVYLAPAYRTFPNALTLKRAWDAELARRGLRAVALCAPPRLARALAHSGMRAGSTYTFLTQEIPQDAVAR